MKTCFSRTAKWLVILGGTLLAVTEAIAAGPSTEAGTIEVAGVFGASAILPDITSGLQDSLNQILGSGFAVSSGSNFKWFTGGSVGFALSPSLMIVGETNYNYAGQANISYSSGGSSFVFSEKLSLTDFTGGAHWQLPVANKKLVPYVAAAVGGVREIVTANGSGLPVNFGTGNTDLTYNFGGGVRYHIRPSWGIRPEVKWVRIPGQNYVRLGVGVFWQSRS